MWLHETNAILAIMHLGIQTIRNQARVPSVPSTGL